METSLHELFPLRLLYLSLKWNLSTCRRCRRLRQPLIEAGSSEVPGSSAAERISAFTLLSRREIPLKKPVIKDGSALNNTWTAGVSCPHICWDSGLLRRWCKPSWKYSLWSLCRFYCSEVARFKSFLKFRPSNHVTVFLFFFRIQNYFLMQPRKENHSNLTFAWHFALLLFVKFIMPFLIYRNVLCVNLFVLW